MAFTRTVAPSAMAGQSEAHRGPPMQGGARVVDSVASRSAEGAQARPDGDERGVFGEHAQAYLPLLRMSFARNYVMRSKAPWMVAPLKSLLSLSSGSCGRYSRLLPQGARGGCS